MAREFNLIPNALKEELDNLSQAGYLGKEQRGQSIFYKANTYHPFFPEINSIVKKYYGIVKIVEQVLNDLGTEKLGRSIQNNPGKCPIDGAGTLLNWLIGGV